MPLNFDVTVLQPGGFQVVTLGTPGPPGPGGTVAGVLASGGDYPAAALAAALGPLIGSGGVTGSATATLPAGGAATRTYGLASAVGNAALCVGLASAAASPGGAVTLRTAGPLTLADWTGATGAASLQAGAPYFVSDVTPGRIAVAVPASAGRVVQCVGRALTSDTLLISVGNPLLL